VDKFLEVTMVDWFLRHGATVLIFGGGVYTAFAALKAERLASGEREKRRVGPWPRRIFLGAVVGGFGALWAGYGQDRLFDYLSGADSYGFFTPGPVTSKSVEFIFVEKGGTPLYDVLVDAVDITRWRKMSSEKGLFPAGAQSEGVLRGAELDAYWELYRETRANLNIGNVAPGTSRFAWEAPAPESDDQEYQFSIWARNGLVTEKLLMHRASDGLMWAWRVERTSPQVKSGRQGAQRLEEYTMPGFPPEKLIWD
jgi:hypothetical protein